VAWSKLILLAVRAFTITLICLVASCRSSACELEKPPISDRLAIQQNGKWGYIDRAGAVVVKPQFDFAHDFAEGFAVVERNGKYGIINQHGEFVIPLELGYAFPFSSGLAAAGNEKLGYVDGSGKFVIAPQFDMVGSFANGVAFVLQGKAARLINKSGKALLSWKYPYLAYPAPTDFMLRFTEGLAPVRLGTKYAYVDEHGKVVIPAKFEFAWNFSEGVAQVRVGGRWGFVDKEGKIVIRPQFEEAGSFVDGIAPVKKTWPVWLHQQTWRFRHSSEIRFRQHLLRRARVRSGAEQVGCHRSQRSPRN